MTTTTGFRKPPPPSSSGRGHSYSYHASGGGTSTAATTAAASAIDVADRHYPPERRALPIFAHRTRILHALETRGVVVLVGETGCGKSTQLPQYLHENGWSDGGREVVCTQPRRMAATTLADRVSRGGVRPVVRGVLGAVRIDVQPRRHEDTVRHRRMAPEGGDPP